jgi:hypothetical protein
MFLSNSIESKESRVVLKDARSQVIYSFISYLYLGKPEMIEEVVDELFVFADKYDLEKLKVCFLR